MRTGNNRACEACVAYLGTVTVLSTLFNGVIGQLGRGNEPAAIRSPAPPSKLGYSVALLDIDANGLEALPIDFADTPEPGDVGLATGNFRGEFNAPRAGGGLAL